MSTTSFQQHSFFAFSRTAVLEKIKRKKRLQEDSDSKNILDNLQRHSALIGGPNWCSTGGGEGLSLFHPSYLWNLLNHSVCSHVSIFWLNTVIVNIPLAESGYIYIPHESLEKLVQKTVVSFFGIFRHNNFRLCLSSEVESLTSFHRPGVRNGYVLDRLSHAGCIHVSVFVFNNTCDCEDTLKLNGGAWCKRATIWSFNNRMYK